MKEPLKSILIGLGIIIAGSIMSYTYLTEIEKPRHIQAIGSTYGYDLVNPTAVYTLPKILEEISGLTDIDDHTIACVQDEEGIVFIYDLQNSEIKEEIKFDKNGDYEGITRVGNTLDILRSDGKLFEIDNFRSKDFKVEEYDTDIPVKDSEGLGHDAANNRILIAGKSEPKGDEYKDKRAVYAFDLSSKKTAKDPVFVLEEEQIKDFIIKNEVKTETNKDDEPKVKINPSGVAIHPTTGKLYVLSSKDNLIYIFNQNSEVVAIHHLDEKLYRQAEGITFMDNGDMLISNEANKRKPTLLKIAYKDYFGQLFNQ